MTRVVNIAEYVRSRPEQPSQVALVDAPAALAVCALTADPPRPTEWLVDTLYPAGDFALIVGEDGVSKSTVALHIGGAVAGGYRAFNRFTTSRGPVLYVSEEDPGDLILARLEALVRGHGWDRERVLTDFHFIAVQGVNLGETEWQRAINAEVRRLHVKLIVLDPLAELLDGDEDSNSDARPIIKALRSLDCACAVVHHFGKRGMGRSDGDRIRGASAWRRAARVIFALEPIAPDGLRVKTLKLTKARAPAPFAIRREIVEEPSNPGTWQSATFTYGDERQARLTGARQWALNAIDESADGLLSTELREAANGSGFSHEDINNAIQTLRMDGQIEIQNRPDDRRNARRWTRRVPF